MLPAWRGSDGHTVDTEANGRVLGALLLPAVETLTVRSSLRVGQAANPRSGCGGCLEAQLFLHPGLAGLVSRVEEPPWLGICSSKCHSP